MAAWSIGIAKRALQMTIEQANQRELFGSKLRDKQAVQWWIANTATKIRASRLMALECAWKQDQGQDVRTEASMLKGGPSVCQSCTRVFISLVCAPLSVPAAVLRH